MKIAYIVRSCNKRGGISRYVAELSETLSNDNDIHIFSSKTLECSATKAVLHKIPMLSLETLKQHGKHALNTLLEVGSFVISSRNCTKGGNFDLIHSQGDYIGSFDVYTAHSCHKAWLDIFNREKHSLLERLKKSSFNPLHFLVLMIEKHCVTKAKKVIAISESVKQELIKFYGIPKGRIVTIYNGVNIEEFNPALKDKYRRQIRDKYLLKADDILILFPAHEFKRKGLTQIIKALHSLNKNNIYVLVAGKDSLSPFMGLIKQYGLEKQFIFTGIIDKIEPYYLASDLLVFPTAYEPFGLVITEAMASGIPVITNRSAGAAELITDGKEGFLLKDINDIDELKSKIELLTCDSVLRDKMGRNARKTAENYTWKIIARKTYEVYEAILKLKN